METGDSVLGLGLQVFGSGYSARGGAECPLTESGFRCGAEWPLTESERAERRSDFRKLDSVSLLPRAKRQRVLY